MENALFSAPVTALRVTYDIIRMPDLEESLRVSQTLLHFNGEIKVHIFRDSLGD